MFSFKGSHSIIKGECFPVLGDLALVCLLHTSRLKGPSIVLEPDIQVVLTTSSQVCHIVTRHSGIEAGNSLQEGER